MQGEERRWITRDEPARERRRAPAAATVEAVAGGGRRRGVGAVRTQE